MCVHLNLNSWFNGFGVFIESSSILKARQIIVGHFCCSNKQTVCSFWDSIEEPSLWRQPSSLPLPHLPFPTPFTQNPYRRIPNNSYPRPLLCIFRSMIFNLGWRHRSFYLISYNLFNSLCWDFALSFIEKKLWLLFNLFTKTNKWTNKDNINNKNNNINHNNKNYNDNNNNNLNNDNNDDVNEVNTILTKTMIMMTMILYSLKNCHF